MALRAAPGRKSKSKGKVARAKAKRARAPSAGPSMMTPGGPQPPQGAGDGLTGMLMSQMRNNGPMAPPQPSPMGPAGGMPPGAGGGVDPRIMALLMARGRMGAM
jgi:hypothetical protein